ncbi:MAG: putative membrane protein [Bacteroidia bacterium]|jgi:putative membrane protein
MQNKDKLFFRFAMTLSVVVFLLVLVLNRKIITPPSTIPSFVPMLPALNATINGLCSLLLIGSLMAIKRKNIQLHKKLNLTTFVLSALFLVSYVTLHFFSKQQFFGGEGAIRYIYFPVLITHIILAALVLPLILFSFYYALNNRVEKHKKIVRFTYPIWLYVTLSGVAVYAMMSPYYQF